MAICLSPVLRKTIRAIVRAMFLCAALLALSCGKGPGQNAAPLATNVTVTLTKPPTIAANTNAEDVEFDIDKATEHLTAGNAFLADGKIGEAVERFTLAVKYNPEDEDLYYNLALAQAKMGDYGGAKMNYAKALEIYPDYVEAHNNLGNLLVLDGKFEEAIQHFSKAVEHDPGNAAAHNNLGNAYARQKKYAQSVMHFQTALELRADYPEAQFNLGNAYLLLGRTDEAIEEFTRVLRLHPDFARARTQLDKALAAKRGQDSPNQSRP